MDDSNNDTQQDALACELHGTHLQHLKGMNADPRVVMLDFRENLLEHFYGLPTLPNVQCMRFDANRVESFLGMSYQPKLQVLTLAGNPITEHPDYRIMALLACGPSLHEIDGRVITDSERTLADELGGASGTLSQLISLGWTSLDYGGSLAAADAEWAMERCRAEFLRVSQHVDDATSFAVVAPQAAELVPLAAERPNKTTTPRPQRLEKLSPAVRAQISPPRTQKPLIPLGESERSIRMRVEAADYVSQHHSPAASSTAAAADDTAPLTNTDVNTVLHSTQHPNFNAAREAVSQQILESRANQLLASANIPKKTNASAVELARQYAKAYQMTTAHAPVALPLPSSSPAGPSPPSNAVSNSRAASARVSGADLTLGRSDIINLGSIEMASFDVSAQWQPPKSGTIQIVRSTLRLQLSFSATSEGEGENNNNRSDNDNNRTTSSRSPQQPPKLVVLDNASRTVASFTLPVSSPQRPQSLWIHDGNPPAIALCSEEDGGVIDVVLMPSAGSANATERAQTLHKLLIHAMADHHQQNHNDKPPVSPTRHGGASQSPTPRSPRAGAIEEL